MMHLLIGLGPCPLGALRVCYQAGKNNDASTYRVGSLSPRSPFGANEKGLKDEGLGFGFHVSAARDSPFRVYTGHRRIHQARS